MTNCATGHRACHCCRCSTKRNTAEFTDPEFLTDAENDEQTANLSNPSNASNPLRVGIGGPVGSGKTALCEALSKKMRDRYEMAVITNDIYTKEDMEILLRAAGIAGRALDGSGNRRLPAYGDQGGCLDQS